MMQRFNLFRRRSLERGAGREFQYHFDRRVECRRPRLWEVFMNRILLTLVMFACLVDQPSWATQPDFHLQVVPAAIYKVDDPGNTRTSTFVFNCCGLFHRLRAHSALRPRGTLKRRIYRRAAGLDNGNVGKG